ncbi:MAG: HD domain-containing protein [Succinivibrionaceae bacterium]|nr:HD domain-containing protein [Succinivibrionaceae bacterium]
MSKPTLEKKEQNSAVLGIYSSGVLLSCLKIVAMVVVSALLSYFIFNSFGTVHAVLATVIISLLMLIPMFIYYERKVTKQGQKIVSLQNHMIRTIADVIEERDASTGGHITRTADLVEMLLQGMAKLPKYSFLTEANIEKIKSAAPLHDVGKIKIPDAVLNKPGKLTVVEYEIMKKHSEYGADLIMRSIKNVEDKKYFSIAYNIALFHHERYDGKGYPTGISGEQIPLEARVMALADVYDALVSPRVYKEPFPKSKAIEILREGRGTQFDPELTDIFINCVTNRVDM